GSQQDTFTELAESPDGRWLAAATFAGSLTVWPARPGEKAIPLEPAQAMERGTTSRLGERTNNAILLAWSPDGKRLAASSKRDTKIHLWDPDNPKKPVLDLPGHGKPMRSLAWSPDGRRLASAGLDGTAKVWDVSSGQETLAPLPFFLKSETGLPS